MSSTVSIGVVMGSSSDWDTLQHAVQILQEFGIAHEARVVSAHRMPDDLFAYAEAASARGLKAIIAGAGGAAHLPGMLAAKTTVPVLGVPVASRHLQGVDSLHSIVHMPNGVPVATFEQLALSRRVAPAAAAVAVCQDRAREKAQFVRCGVPCAPHAVIERAADVDAVDAGLLPGILKTARLGYDGKGQVRVDD